MVSAFLSMARKAVEVALVPGTMKGECSERLMRDGFILRDRERVWELKSRRLLDMMNYRLDSWPGAGLRRCLEGSPL